ncbi:uncharacterized protein LOC116027066 [Ipomoea triloba]|uniref:uncharacterized protein LOC116027066 n=1 Tax=Ipomoea triloba TaxID=35885 RepID=UPI00125D098E|nr:uncharacterized protein LOC116027066 [Ipomoea triloba]
MVPETPIELRPDSMAVDGKENGLRGTMVDLVDTSLDSSPQKDRPSYKQTLTGERVDHGRVEAEDRDFDSEDDEIEDEEEDKDCPTIRLTRAEKRILRAPWKQTLIIKLWGRSVGYNYLLRKLQNMWKPSAPMDLVAIENDYFLVRFTAKKDYEFAKLEGPWMILDHYLVVKEWHPNFDPLTDKTEKLIVWVRFPCLPIEYFNFVFLEKVGKKIGKPIRADISTDMATRGRYARICVEVDITKPLLAKFKLYNRVRRIEYEGIHLVCFGCGRYGHKKEACPVGNKADNPVEMDNVQPNQNPLAGEEGANKEEFIEIEGNFRKLQIIRPEVVEDFGPWMLAQRKQRRFGNYNPRTNTGRKHQGNVDNTKNKEVQKKHPQKPVGENSRFNVLYDLEENDNEQTEDCEQREVVQLNSRDHTAQPSRGLQGKGKRPQIQISAKQIDNDKNQPRQPSSDKPRERAESSKSGGMNGSNQAAAEVEHVVVRGTQKGKNITRTVVETGGVGEKSDSLLSHDAANHHQDPPFHDMGMNCHSASRANHPSD